MDGVLEQDGAITFITANNPEILDDALLRSCRIDHKFELDYAGKYQTNAIFEMVLPEQKENFAERQKQIELAMQRDKQHLGE